MSAEAIAFVVFLSAGTVVDRFPEPYSFEQCKREVIGAMIHFINARQTGITIGGKILTPREMIYVRSVDNIKCAVTDSPPEIGTAEIDLKFLSDKK